MARNKSWYEIKAQSEDDTTIYVYDEISSYGISANQFVKDLNEVKSGKIKLRINSPGGNVFDGVTIHNALKEHPATVNVIVDGLAASIASIIAMAGDNVHMADNAMMMIHQAWAFAMGNADDLQKTVEVLQKIDGTLVKTYADKTGATQRNIRQMMKDETWMTAQEAKDLGFADTIGDRVDAKASFDLSKYANVPQEAMAMYAAPKEPTERDIETILRDAGISHKAAKAAVASIKVNHRDDESLKDAVAELSTKIQIETLIAKIKGA